MVTDFPPSPSVNSSVAGHTHESAAVLTSGVVWVGKPLELCVAVPEAVPAHPVIDPANSKALATPKIAFMG